MKTLDTRFNLDGMRLKYQPSNVIGGLSWRKLAEAFAHASKRETERAADVTAVCPFQVHMQRLPGEMAVVAQLFDQVVDRDLRPEVKKAGE